MQERADTQLDQIAAAWDALLEQSSEALLLLDGAGQILAASAAAARVLGWPRAALAGADARALLGLGPAEPFANAEPPALPGHSLRHTPLVPTGALLTIAPQPTPTAIQQEQRLREVLMTIGSALDIDQILHTVVRLAVELCAADAGSLPLYDARNEQVLPGYMVNVGAAERLPPHRRGTGLIWRVIDSQQPLVCDDYPGDPDALPLLIARGVRAVIALPVFGGAELLAVLILYHCRPGRRFTARDVELLEVVGRQTGVALQNARLYQSAVVEAARRHTLYSASVKIGAALDAEELYAVIHQSAERLMRCDTIAIGLLDEERQEIEYVYLWDRVGRWPGRRLPVARGLIGYVVRHGLSLRIENNDPQTEAIFNTEPFGEGEDESRAILATVLSAGELVIGGITVQSSTAGSYSASDLNALEMLAATAAIAIQNAQLFAQIQQLATLDSLTGVPNRRHFYEQAIREVERAARYGHPLSMLMLDADHFKAVNDTYGHIAGDQVLQMIAARCRDDLREVDLLARFGGEEFAALLPNTDKEQALQVARRLAARVADQPIVTDAGPLSVTISLGVASFPAGRVASLETLLAAADEALYRAKGAGRNQVSG